MAVIAPARFRGVIAAIARRPSARSLSGSAADPVAGDIQRKSLSMAIWSAWLRFFSKGKKKKLKDLFKSKTRTPVEIVRKTRDLLVYMNTESNTSESKREDKAQKDATQVVANLQRQPVHSRLIASDYLEANKDLLDILISGYNDMDIALHYGAMLRECIRHQSIARSVLESGHMKKFFDYLQFPNFDISSDVFATFRELMTRHKSTVAEFLSKNYDWFFTDFNEKLLLSSNYVTARQAIKLLGDMLLDRSNSDVMTRYVSSKDNLIVPMNLLRDKSRSIQIEAFHVFKLFVANQNKPAEIGTILMTNKSKILRLMGALKLDKEDEQFEADKTEVMKEITALSL